MSASRMPTDAPSAASASAAAVVDLPTPPLPLATATMFFTPGISFTPRCTACDTTFNPTVTVTRPAPGSAADRVAHQLLQALVLALRRVPQCQVDRDIGAIQPDLAHGLARDEIAAGIGIDDAG